MSTAFIALFLFGLALLIAREFNLVIEAWTGNVQVAVYLTDSANPETVTLLTTKLDALPAVGEVTYESKADAVRAVQGAVREPAGVRSRTSTARPGEQPVPGVAAREPGRHVAVRADRGGDGVQHRRRRANSRAAPGVETVAGLPRAARRGWSPSPACSRSGSCRSPSIMLASAVALIANTLRMGMFARRKEIGIMRLVGATNWRIRVPFLIEGLVESLLGAAAAIFALFLVKVVFIDRLRGRDQVLPADPEPRRAGDRAVDPDRRHRHRGDRRHDRDAPLPRRLAGAMSPQPEAAEKTVASNRRARHDYDDPGALRGRDRADRLRGEVAARRVGRRSPRRTRASRGGELWLESMHIPPYEQGEKRGYDPLRPRKLLLHRKEIERLIRQAEGAEAGARADARVLLARPGEGGARPRHAASASTRSVSRPAEAPGRARDGARRRPAALVLKPVGRLPYTRRDNCIWGCTGFDLDVHRLGEAGRDPGCLVKRRINTSADNYALAA